MANDIIKGAGDVYQKDLYGDLSKSAKEVLPLLDKINQVLKATTKSNEALVSVEAKNVESLQKVNQGLQKTDQAFKQKLKLDNERIKVSNQLKSATDEEVKGKIRLQKATKAQRDTLKDELILQDKSAGTLEKVAASSRKLRREREKLNLDTQKGRDRLKEINKQLDLNNKKVLKNSDSLKKQKINVGNYSNSIKDAAGASGLFSGQLAALQRIQATLNAFTKKNTAETQANAAAQRASGKAVSGTSKALKVLKIALISTGIGAIVVGLGSLIAAFAGTQRGADAFTKVLRPLQTLFQRFIGFLEGTAFSAFDRLKEAFENPKQAVIDLANAIKNNLIKRFESLSILGGAIVKIFSGDFKEGFKELADGAVQLGTGIENVSEKINNLTEDVKGFVDESIKQGDELDALIKRFERRQIDTVIPLAKARLEFQALKAIAQDQTALDQDRIDALIKAESIQRTIAETENELLQLKIDRVELETIILMILLMRKKLELVKLKADQLNADAAAQKKINGFNILKKLE